MPVPTFPSLITPVAGKTLGATQVNALVKAVEYLHGMAAGGDHPFTGIYWSSANTYGDAYRGYFHYGGVKKLYHDFTKIGGGTDLTITVTHDGGTLTFNHPWANPLDLSAGTFTVGTKYLLTAKANSNGQGVSMTYAYVPVTLGYAWATPTTFTDTNTSAAADFSTLITDCNCLRQLLEVRRTAFRSASTNPYLGATTLPFYGSFIYRGLNTLHMHGSVGSGSADSGMEVYVNGTKVDDVGAAGGNLTATYDLTGLGLVVGTRYTVYASVISSSGNRVTGTPKRFYIDGNKALTNTPQRWEVGTYGYGSSGANRLQYISDSLTTLRTLAEYETISGTDYARQYLTPDNVSPNLDPVNSVSFTFQDFKLTRRYRWLLYKPTAADATGTLTYGDATESLPDNNGDGTWTGFDLETLPLLPLGFTYKVTDVSACMESPTSS